MNSLGISDVEELYADLPQEIRLKRKLNLPGPMSEFEVKRHVEQLLSVNRGFPEIRSFLGGGCWNHYVPAAVSEISTRSEFVTAYTPYQAEISQGILQSLFEYQSLICQLTAMDYANSSLYDWASALGESARMAARATQRNEFLVPRHIDQDRLATLRTYSEPAGITVKEVRNDEETGQMDLADLERKISKDCSAVYVENPSYLGCVQTRVQEIAEIAHSRGALLVAGVDLTSLGLLKPPGEYGADIVVAEGQCLGGAMNYGGPLLGVFACKGERLLRHMPGRIIGITTTKERTQRAYCMVLQAREQHIRREKATSNICTNEALCALTAATYLSLLGAQGMKQLSEVILSKTYYAIRELSELKALRVPLMKAPHFKEFTVNFDGAGRDVKMLELALIKKGMQIGASTPESIPELGQTAIFSVTETNSKEDIDTLCAALRDILEA